MGTLGVSEAGEAWDWRLTDSQPKNGEIDENVEAMDVLAEEVVAKQQEVIDVTSALDDYRDKAEIVYWAGDVVIVVLVIALIYVARQN